MARRALLEIEGLTVDFVGEDGLVRAVDDVSLTIGKGETVVVVGESGSGKSVTSLAAMGLVRPPRAFVSARRMAFERRDGNAVELHQLPEAEMRRIRGNEIAMIFQEPMTSLNPVFTIGRQIREAILVHQGGSRPQATARAAELLETLGISDPQRRLRAFPHQLSGGMRQRVMIAMALACRPSLLIADEPTTALDVTIQAQILELITALQREMGMSVLFITHNLGVAAEIADRIVVLYAGRTVEDGPVGEIFARPLMPYTRGLIRSVPRLGAMADRDEELPSIPGNVPSPWNFPAGCPFHPRCPHFRPVTCDSDVPPLETASAGHRVRCARWREIAPADGARP